MKESLAKGWSAQGNGVEDPLFPRQSEVPPLEERRRGNERDDFSERSENEAPFKDIRASECKPGSGELVTSLGRTRKKPETFDIVGRWYGSIDGKRPEKWLLILREKPPQPVKRGILRSVRQEVRPEDLPHYLYDNGEYAKGAGKPTVHSGHYREEADEEYTVVQGGEPKFARTKIAK